MRRRPMALTFFSFVMGVIFFNLPLQAIYLQDFENVLQSMTWLNIIVAVFCLLTAIASYNTHKSIRFLLPTTVASVIYNNWWVGHVGLNYSATETSAASLSFVIFCTILLEPNTFKVLHNPKLKWWNVPVRKQTEIPVSLILLRGDTLMKKSFDISESGLFLQGLEKQELEGLKIDEILTVCMHFNKILKVRCSAKIVRKAEANGIYPSGIGLQFFENSPMIRTTMRQLTESNY